MSELIVEGITKEFPARGEPVVVLRGVSLRVSSGESLAILGPSGSGKSTLLYIVGTLDRPTTGSVAFDGQDPFSLSEPELAAFRNRRIGFVFQEHHLLPQCTVLENVLLPTLADGRPDAAAVARAGDLIERVGLSHRTTHRPAELSGGERQRVAIARALIERPSVLLADEPTGNLDRTTAAAIGKLLIELQTAENTMLIAVTHSQELAAMMRRRFALDQGQLVER